MLTLLITIIFNMFFKGFLGLIPILLGIVGGYIIACLFGIVKFSGVMSAHWFSLPAFQIPFVNYSPAVLLGRHFINGPDCLCDDD